MKKITSTNKYIIIHSKNNKDIPRIKNQLKIAERKNNNIYGINLTKIKVVVCDSINDFKKDPKSL